MTLGSRLVLMFRNQCGLCTLYAFSPWMFTCALLPTDAGRETSSPETALSEKQAKKEKERLIKELQLITEERNDLRDRLRFLTERSMKNKYELLQTFLFQSWVCKVTFISSY